MSDDLTPAEAAFFESGGEKPIDDAPAAPAVEAPAAPAEPQSPEKPAEQAGAVGEPQEATTAPEGLQHIPLAVFMEEKGRRKSAEKEAREFKEQLQRLAGRLDVLTGGQTQEQRGELDPVIQPIEVLQQLVESDRQRKANDAAQGQYQEFTNRVNAAENEFKTNGKVADFDEALNYLRTGRFAELKAIGYDDAGAAQVLQQEAIGISSLAMQQGANPAERFYALAKARGYASKAPETTNGAAAVDPTITAAAAMTAAAQGLEKLAKAQGAAKSLGQGGGAGSDTLTLEALASMDDDEFDKVKESQWKKMMGG